MAINDNDIRVKRTKRLIRQGLSELAKTKSLSKISVKELTDLVEINRGTFYLHYKDISDLVESIETNLYNEFSAFMHSITPQNVSENALDLLEKYVYFAYENKDVLEMLVGAHGDAEFAFKLTSLMDEKIYDLCKTFYPNMNHTLFDMASEFGKFGALGLLNCWFTKHPEWTPRQIAEMWLTLMTRGLYGITQKEPEED